MHDARRLWRERCTRTKGADERSVIRRRARRDGRSSRRCLPTSRDVASQHAASPSANMRASRRWLPLACAYLLWSVPAVSFAQPQAQTPSQQPVGTQPRSRGRRRESGARGRGGRPRPDVPQDAHRLQVQSQAARPRFNRSVPAQASVRVRTETAIRGVGHRPSRSDRNAATYGTRGRRRGAATQREHPVWETVSDGSRRAGGLSNLERRLDRRGDDDGQAVHRFYRRVVPPPGSGRNPLLQAIDPHRTRTSLQAARARRSSSMHAC